MFQFLLDSSHYSATPIIEERGGFDAIITNLPWEIFKPQAKELFAQHSELVTKNKMDIKAFQKEQKKLLENPEVANAWLGYQSQYRGQRCLSYHP